ARRALAPGSGHRPPLSRRAASAARLWASAQAAWRVPQLREDPQAGREPADGPAPERRRGRLRDRAGPRGGVTMASRGYILTFHSHNISGNTYETNDHVALDRTLAVLERLRIPVLRLLDVASRLRAKTFEALPP